ncbi:hypothetical protein H0H87_003348 [Tephrocybe sp. NHM501043]|nr:hypothetical protein H0H87_003348 [Tephrocybe sp. NHM501043]
MTFSPDETLLISTDANYIRVWETHTYAQKYYLELCVAGHSSVAFSPDSRTFLTGAIDQRVSLWNSQTGEQIGKSWEYKTSYTGPVSVTFRSCGTIAIACHDDMGYLLDLKQPGKPPSALLARTSEAAFTLDGSQILSYFTSEGKTNIQLRNLWPLLLDSQTQTPFKAEWTALSSRGSFLVSASTNEILCWKLDAMNCIGNPLKGISSTVVAIGFSSDDSRIVGASEDGTAYYWDSTSLELLSALDDCVHGTSSISFSPMGDAIIATLNNNGRVVLKVQNDVLSCSDESEYTQALQQVEAASKSTFFDLDSSPITFGSDPAMPNRGLKDVQWYPGKSDSTVLAYVNNHFIRAGKDGAIVIIPDF